MTDITLSFDLVDNQFGVTIGFKVLYPHMLSELGADKQSIVLSDVVGVGFCQLRERM